MAVDRAGSSPQVEGCMSMTGKLFQRMATVVAVASLGIAALTGCTSGTPTPQRTAMTIKAAGSYYVAMMCTVDTAADAMTTAENTAEVSTSETGPDLDNLKAAA